MTELFEWNKVKKPLDEPKMPFYEHLADEFWLMLLPYGDYLVVTERLVSDDIYWIWYANTIRGAWNHGGADTLEKAKQQVLLQVGYDLLFKHREEILALVKLLYDSAIERD